MISHPRTPATPGADGTARVRSPTTWRSCTSRTLARRSTWSREASSCGRTTRSWRPTTSTAPWTGVDPSLREGLRALRPPPHAAAGHHPQCLRRPSVERGDAADANRIPQPHQSAVNM